MEDFPFAPEVLVQNLFQVMCRNGDENSGFFSKSVVKLVLNIMERGLALSKRGLTNHVNMEVMA